MLWNVFFSIVRRDNTAFSVIPQAMIIRLLGFFESLSNQINICEISSDKTWRRFNVTFSNRRFQTFEASQKLSQAIKLNQLFNNGTTMKNEKTLLKK